MTEGAENDIEQIKRGVIAIVVVLGMILLTLLFR